MNEEFDIEKIFEILHKEYGDYVIKEVVTVKDWSTESQSEYSCERTFIKICSVPGDRFSTGCTISDQYAIQVNGRSVLMEDVNYADIEYLKEFVFKWLITFGPPADKIYAGRTPNKMLNWKDLPYLPSVTSTVLQQMRTAAPYIAGNRTALTEYFSNEELSAVIRFLEKLQIIYPIGTV